MGPCLDVNSFFANIPLKETIDICPNANYSQQDVTEAINKEKFRNLLSLATKESDLIFKEVLHKVGVLMSFLLGSLFFRKSLSLF